MPPTPSPPSFSWRALFEASSTAVFVIGADRTLRYANPAWEKLTDSDLEKLRGTKFSEVRESASPLWKSLAPPPEAWLGPVARIRRPLAGSSDGPPWWDVAYVPLFDTDNTVSAIIGSITVVGDNDPTPAAFTPAPVGAARASIAARFTLETLAGKSLAASRLVSQVRAAAESPAPVWIRGECGTGKETVARVIHHTSARRERAFLALECAGLQPYMIEGLLSGKGGLAAGPHVGTLVLKNPARLARDVQKHLLDWCTEPAGPRLICTATDTATEAVQAGKLLPQFETQASALEIALPPLRDRLADLPRLIERILERFEPKPTLAEEVIPVLGEYRWPGNLRELVSVIGQCVELAKGGKITRELLPRVIQQKFLIASNPVPSVKSIALDAVLEEVERRLIAQAMTRANGHHSTAADRLGIPRARLIRRIEALGLNTPTDGSTP